MILSVFEHIRGSLDVPAEAIFDKLAEINCKVFEPIHNQEEDGVVFNRAQSAKIIAYLLYAYSEQSDFLVLGADSQKEKQEIAERVELPEDLHEKVVRLSSGVVRKVVVNYLDTQSSRAFRYLSFKKDMYEAAMANALLKMKDGEGNMDMKEMVDTDKFLQSLLTQIKEYEDQLRSEYKYVYDNKEEIGHLEALHRKKRDSGNVENSQYIN